jgi:hypothetical protein
MTRYDPTASYYIKFVQYNIKIPYFDIAIVCLRHQLFMVQNTVLMTKLASVY